MIFYIQLSAPDTMHNDSVKVFVKIIIIGKGDLIDLSRMDVIENLYKIGMQRVKVYPIIIELN